MMTRRSFFAASGLAAAAVTLPAFAADKKPADKKPSGELPLPEGVIPGGSGKGNVKFHLGIAGFTFARLKLDKALEIMKKVDVHYLCVKDFHLSLGATDAEMAAFKAKLAAADVNGYAVGPIYMSSADEAKKAFDYAKRLGVKTIIGVPFQPGKDGKGRFASRDLLVKAVEPLVKEYDIRYAIHNHGPDMPELFPTGDSVWEMVKDLDPRIGLCLDIGHQFRFGSDPVKAIHDYHTRLFDMHIKNVSEPTKAGRALPMPRGAMDLVAVVKALAEVGYDGCCSLEYERDMSDPILGIAESIGYFRGLMDSIRG